MVLKRLDKDAVIGALSSEHLRKVNLNVEKVELTVNKENLNIINNDLCSFYRFECSNDSIEKFYVAPLKEEIGTPLSR